MLAQVILLTILASSSKAEVAPLFAKKADLLKVRVVTEVYSDIKTIHGEPNGGYRLAFEEKLENNAGPNVRVRVWDTNTKSFPGSQPPIIQVLDGKRVVLANIEMSDPCWMLNGRLHGMRHSKRHFVYIQCQYRQGLTPVGTHIFEIIRAEPWIKEGGIFWPESKDEQGVPNHSLDRPAAR